VLTYRQVLCCKKAGGHFSDLLKRRAALPVSSLVEDHFPAGSGLYASISPVAFYFCTKKNHKFNLCGRFSENKNRSQQQNTTSYFHLRVFFRIASFDFYVDSCASEILRELLFLAREIKNVISLAREQTRRRLKLRAATGAAQPSEQLHTLQN
jgi:hypothetical protein